MFNVYRNQLSRQTGSRNLTGTKTLPTIWYTYMMLVTKYQIVTEKNATKNILDGRTDRQTDRGKTEYPPPPSGSGGIITSKYHEFIYENEAMSLLLWFSVSVVVLAYICRTKVKSSINTNCTVCVTL